LRNGLIDCWKNKGKIKELLHLGTEFEYSRTIDDDGQVVDPFVPKFDITKVINFQKEIDQSQKVRVESPRFIRTLRKALYEVFYESDKDHSGYLDYNEFKESFKKLSYGLNDNDIYTLIALADEDDDGKITWEEFVPIGIEAIKTFYARNKLMQKSKDAVKELDKDAMEKVYYPEINKAWEILEKEFKKQDIHQDGKVTLFQLKKVLRKSNLVTPKELNAIVRNCDLDTYEYSFFKQDLFNVRFELSKSRILESNMDLVQKSLVEECEKFDTTRNGKIHITQMNDILKNSKFILLSPFQIHTVLGQAEIDEKRYLNYRKFVFKVKEMINSLFSVEALSESAELIKQGKVSEEEVKQTYISNLDLFKIFKEYDRNMNGFLELDEYMLCLKDQDLDLSSQEIVSLSLVADTDGNGQIDYEEFMKHFREVLDMVRFQTLVNTQTAEIMERRIEERVKKAKDEEEKRQEEDL